MSNERKLKIATYFVMSSPTGQVDMVIKDMKVLAKDALTDKQLEKVMHDYNTEQMICAKAPDGQPCLVTAYAEVDAKESVPSKYLDPENNRILVFDHVSGKFTKETDDKQNLNKDVASFRLAVEESVKKYIGISYKSGKSHCAVYGGNDGTITVCLSASNINLANYWSGGWRSVYTFNCQKKGTQDVVGAVKNNVHYYEAGNVQLHSEKEAKFQVDTSSPEECASTFVKQLEEFESGFQQALEILYIEMHKKSFKAMRRLRPITLQKMQWSEQAHKLRSMINK